jgi:hypothetical protein
MSKMLNKLIESGHIEGYDDERNIDNGLIVYLKPGKQWSLDPGCHTRGFDTVTEAVQAIRTEIMDYPDDPELQNQNQHQN